MWPFDSPPPPKKRVHHYTDFLGRKVTKVDYGDTGKQEKHVTKAHWWSGTVHETTITRPGVKTCFRCHKTVTCDSGGVYRCSCGKVFR